MALYEATNTLLEFEMLQNSALLPLSPTTPCELRSPLLTLSPVTSASDNNSGAQWAAISDDDEEESTMTSLTNASQDCFFRVQPFSVTSHGVREQQQPHYSDVSELSPSVSSSSVADADCPVSGEDSFHDFDVEDFTSGFQAGEGTFPVSSSTAIASPVTPASPITPASSHATHASSRITRRAPPTSQVSRLRKSATEKKRGMKKPSPRPTSANNSLPPCRICADAASGFHYGVNTCEACKRFFRRAFDRKRTFKCKGIGQCVIKGQKNSLCGHCRYQECLALGMSKTAIKTGRYTHAKRAQDVQEVQRLGSKDVEWEMAETEATSILERLEAAHSCVMTTEDFSMENMIRCAEVRKEEILLRKEMFGIKDELTYDQFNDVYRETGLDLDGRRAHIQHVAKAINGFIRGYVRFGKVVPGFSELSISDQSSVLKLARQEIWLLGVFRGFLLDLDMFYAPNHDVRHRCEMEALRGKDYAETSFRLAGVLQDLDLTHQEIVVLKAVCLTFSDRCELEDKAKMDEIQWRMLRCLLHLLRQNHPEDPGIYYKVVNWTVAARELTKPSDPHFNSNKGHAEMVNMLVERDFDDMEEIQWRMLRCLLHLLRQNHPEDPGIYYKVVNWTVAARELTEFSRQEPSDVHFNTSKNHAEMVNMLVARHFNDVTHIY